MTTFKEGDKVRVVRRAGEVGEWGDVWVSSMDPTVNDGKTYTILVVRSPSMVKLAEVGYNFPTSCLVRDCPALFDGEDV